MRYWAFIDGNGNWQGQRPLTAAQYLAVHSALAGKRPEFLSLNTYDQDGAQTGFRLVFDLDHPTDLHQAHTDAVEVFATIANLTGEYPAIYFSGSKGYHIETNFHIHGPRAHELAHMMAKKLFPYLPSLDMKIYRQRSMFRLPNSPASKPAYFKVRLTPEDLDLPSLFHQELSMRRSTWEPDFPAKPDYKRLAEMLLEATKDLPPRANYSPTPDGPYNEDLFVQPCIERMAAKAPVEGQRHLTIFVLARHLKQFGRTEPEAIAELLNNPNLGGLEKEIKNVTRSIYRSSRPMQVGCRGMSNEALIMRENCDPWCPYSKDPLPTPTRSVSEDKSMGNRTVLQSPTAAPSPVCQRTSVVGQEQPR